ncbi:MAG: stage 0 sporulation family protein [Oscillospiraceae bacterium]|nr:stage 0 sporulation family protein [Oscillospiraceae bacterium]
MLLLKKFKGVCFIKYIAVRFKKLGTIYYYFSKNDNISNKDKVVVETPKGIKCLDILKIYDEIPNLEKSDPINEIIRIATQEDLDLIELNKEKSTLAFSTCLKKIKEHKLEMKLIEVEYTFDSSKIIFYFTADGRIDFRNIVKDLASIFKKRIELRQIGVRDEAKIIGSLGICGQTLCCSRFLTDFQSVSIKMAKEQNLSLNPTKISGRCGRLMCCLKYEQDTYSYLLSTSPKIGTKVKLDDDLGVIIDINILNGNIKIKLDDKPDAIPTSTNLKNIIII